MPGRNEAMNKNNKLPALAAALTALLILGACQGASAQNASQRLEGVPEVNLSAIDDAELQTVLQDFEIYAENGRKDWQVPGMAVAIVRGNDTIYMHSFGNRSINGTSPVTNDTIFQIGSTSKAFTTTLVAMQVDKDNIKWDDRVIDHLPEFQMYDPWVTREFMVEDLMAQHSGLPGYSADSLSILGYNRSYIKHAVRYIKPVTSFRSAYAYQNNLFLFAAGLVENKTGKSWEEDVQESIFEVLGMANSTTGMKPFQNESNVASLHIMEDGRVRALPMDWKYLDWVYIYGPAGGINSNIIDMTKWLRLQMNNGAFEGRQLVSEENIRYTHSPKTIIGQNPLTGEGNVYYCQGWIYHEYNPYPIIWHNGGTSGHHTMVAFIPQSKIGIVVLSNAGYTQLPEALAFRFFDMYFGKPEVDWSAGILSKVKEAENLTNSSMPKPPATPSPALDLSSYVGNYTNEIYGQINVTSAEDGLMATAGPVKAEMILKPWDRDIFRISVPDFADNAGFASFQISPEGNASGVVMDVFDGATFNRG